MNCGYCGNLAKLVSGAGIYPHRPDLQHMKFYSCASCQSYVGCHKGTTKPLGTLANEATRKARAAAHRAFDPLWQQEKLSRNKAYKLLAAHLDIDKKQCHIAMMDEETAYGVVAFANTRKLK